MIRIEQPSKTYETKWLEAEIELTVRGYIKPMERQNDENTDIQ